MSVFDVMTWGEGVGIGVSGAVYCTLQGVAKVNSEREPYLVANEYICARLGSIIGLPMPPGVLVHSEKSELGFVSLRFGRKGEKPPPADAEGMASSEPKLASGAIAFDCWIANVDRHNGNLAYESQLVPVTLFDHSHALFGAGKSGPAHLTNVRDQPFVSACLGPHLSTGVYFGPWAERIRAVDRGLIGDLCDELVRHGGLSQADSDEAVEFICYRKDRILPLLASAQQQQMLPKLTEKIT